MTRKKNSRFSAVIALACIVVTTIVSCKEDDDNGQSTTATPPKTEQSPATQSGSIKNFLAAGKFAHLAIHKDSLEKFFHTNPPTGLHAKKMVFRFGHDGDNASPVIIDGFLTKTNNINFLDRPAVVMASCGNLTSDFSGQRIYLSDLELSRIQYGELRKSMGNNQYLNFYPHVISTAGSKLQYSVTYRMTWISDCQTFAPPQVQITNYDPAADLNPCPPNQPGQ